MAATQTVPARRGTHRKGRGDTGRSDKGRAPDAADRPPFRPTLPRVNLLPPSVGARFAARRIRRALISVAVAIALALGAVWFLQSGRIEEATGHLEMANADNQLVQDKLAALAPIKQMHDQIVAEQTLVATTLAAQPQARAVIAQLFAAGTVPGIGQPVEFGNASVDYHGLPDPGAPLNPCPSPDPFATDITIGCVTFTGTARTRDDLSAMLTALAADPFFVGPFITSSTVSTETDRPREIRFTGTVGVSTDALARPLSEEDLAALRAATDEPADGAGR